ncbi:MAG: Uncharacterised protein [Pseudidiomarina mangrovi]|nr:MAG: Uncharacterised protein [Pseudidiomarina mangrovi]
MRALLLVILLVTSTSHAGPRVASLNICYDAWLVELLPADWQVVPTSEHGNRLEALMILQPDLIVAGSFTDQRLLQALQTVAPLHVLQQPNNYQQWQSEVARLGEFLQQPQMAQAWLHHQQQQLQQLTADVSEVLIIMPNNYTWANDSWASALLRHFSVTLVTPIENGYIGHLRLESLFSLSSQRVVFEGFSGHFSRGQDWLHHPALRRWLQAKTVTAISADIASCPAVNAVAYVQQLLGEQQGSGYER